MSDPTPAAAPAADAPAPAAPAAPAAPPAPALPMPARGGCWVRLPDGSLVPDPAWQPAGGTDKE